MREIVEIYFFNSGEQDTDFQNIEIRKATFEKGEIVFGISLYDKYEHANVYDIPKEKIVELRDTLNEMLGEKGWVVGEKDKYKGGREY